MTTSKANAVIGAVYELQYPVELAGETVSQVVIGRIKGKHLRSLKRPNAPSMDDIMALAAQVMGESGLLLDEMDAADVLEICDRVGERFNVGRRTGPRA
jgi:hypothetical protein